jgi:hypothetical protein
VWAFHDSVEVGPKDAGPRSEAHWFAPRGFVTLVCWTLPWSGRSWEVLTEHEFPAAFECGDVIRV